MAINWVYKEKGGDWYSTLIKPVIGRVTVEAEDGQADYYLNGKWYDYLGVEKDPIITYLPNSIEIDVGGNPAAVKEDSIANVQIDKLSVNELEVRKTTIPETGVQIGGGELLWGDGTITGSNANGTYTKYPNGDLECSIADLAGLIISTTRGQIFMSEEVVWTYPAAFIEIPICNAIAATSNAWATANYGNLSGVSLRAFDGVSNNTRNLYVTAKGRWK